MQSHAGCISPGSCFPRAVLAALQGLSTDLKKKKKEKKRNSLFCSLKLCWAILEQGEMIDVDVYLWERKGGKSFLGNYKPLLF